MSGGYYLVTISFGGSVLFFCVIASSKSVLSDLRDFRVVIGVELLD